MAYNSRETIVIDVVSNGCIISVGCRSFVIPNEKLENALSDLSWLIRKGRTKELLKKWAPDQLEEKICCERRPERPIPAAEACEGESPYNG